MIRKLLTVSALVIAFSISFVNANAGQIAEGLEDFIAENHADGYAPVLVVLSEQVDSWALVDELKARHATLAERHEIVMTELIRKAEVTQPLIIDRIEALIETGDVREYTSLWVMNVIGMTANMNAINQIAALDQVAMVHYDPVMELIKPVNEPNPVPGDDIASVEEGLEAIKADDCWAMGITGSGVLVSHLDTGVDGNHPTMYDRWRGHDSRYSNNPEWAWHDPLTHTNFPFDDGYHGTHTMGTICGRDSGSGDTIGVAIDAEWISAGVVDRGGDLPTRMLRYLTAFQWTLDPDGNPGTMWDVPAVNSNSWGHYPGSMPGGDCDDYYWATLSNMEAAGICVVFAAGNEGSLGLRNPGVRATDDYNSYSVGAVDGGNPSYPIASFSARGPSYCTPSGDPAIKPEVVAPGVDVNSAYPGGSYTTLSGTSMATPHVAGVVALMKQANPGLPPEDIKQILMDTAYDLGPSGEDNTYGWGMIDAYEAVQMAMSMLDDWGHIRGRVTDYGSGSPLDAILAVTNRTPQINAQTDESGWYTLLVPADTLWEITCEVPNSQYFPQVDSVTAIAGDTVFLNFRMRLPAATVTMIPHNAPVMVRAGQTFSYIGMLESNSDQTQSVDVWVMLGLPGGSTYGPIQQFNNINLNPFQEIIIWNVQQYVPTYAPVGVYDYIANCGDYPSVIFDTSSFQFTVYSGLGTSTGNDEWRLSGWFDDNQDTGLPAEFKLHGNVPNPFNAQTRISFELPEDSDVNLSVYNLAGQKVATLADGYLQAGAHNLNWDASSYSSGVYFYKLSAGDKVITKKMSLLK
ncbi:MAG: S8 family serine peptidase [candidate division Zixibacteria bacterium]|nr:S8 family serine peptidase [candidate division Zixibacteria bacterium]